MPGERRVEYPREFQEGLEAESIRELANKLTNALKGQTNNYFLTELTPNETITVITVDFARVGSYANFSPTSPGAAVAIAAGVVWATVENGKITINHDSSAETGRTLGVTLVG